MSVDMDVHGYPWIWISMDTHRKSVDMDMDMDVKFHIHGNPVHCSTSNLVPETLKHDKISGIIFTSVPTPNYGGLVAPFPRDLRLCP